MILLYGLIFTLLVWGSYTDYKTQLVSNWITYSILLISVPLIIWNKSNITWFHFLLIALFFILYVGNALGGADFKVLLPIILSFNVIGFIWFSVVMVLIGGMLLHPRFKLRATLLKDTISIPRLKLFPAIALSYCFTIAFFLR